MLANTGCDGCRNGAPFPVAFTMAFHPIVDIEAGSIWGYEALVRGTEGQGAGQILSHVTDENRYTFDQACRVKAIELAGSRLKDDGVARLSINFMPNAVYEPSACIRSSLAAAAKAKFDPRRLMFEFTENERMDDTEHVRHIVSEYKRMGFTTALDDFGAGYAGLGLLARFQPDLIKIDMELVRDISSSPSRQAIVKGIIDIARTLNITVLAEGIESGEELASLRDAGVRLFQGYFFAKPQLERFVALGEIDNLAAARAH
ncbi:EAL domain-containing protein [Arsenicitalea aurantiaca]|uniref:EAL domain-containing protein n=1 Tax=Arsenicitalea aurantiaca TaxID=1783274 RepID=A0A433XGK2_9HYPH|nr:EAL domain-containing protein [Arsenicitalea aurantiaca]RUT33144.1 EAL domain-containing protein [Arsenicitalea aurantiaca]